MSKTQLYPHAHDPAEPETRPLDLHDLEFFRPSSHAELDDALHALVPPSEPYRCEPAPAPAIVAQRIIDVGEDSWHEPPRPVHFAPAQRTKILRPVMTPREWFIHGEGTWTLSG